MNSSFTHCHMCSYFNGPCPDFFFPEDLNNKNLTVTEVTVHLHQWLKTSSPPFLWDIFSFNITLGLKEEQNTAPQWETFGSCNNLLWVTCQKIINIWIQLGLQHRAWRGLIKLLAILKRLLGSSGLAERICVGGKKKQKKTGTHTVQLDFSAKLKYRTEVFKSYTDLT